MVKNYSWEHIKRKLQDNLDINKKNRSVKSERSAKKRSKKGYDSINKKLHN